HLTAYFLPVLGSFPRATGLEVSDASGVPVIIQELDGHAKERGLTRETIEARLNEVFRQNRWNQLIELVSLSYFRGGDAWASRPHSRFGSCSHFLSPWPWLAWHSRTLMKRNPQVTLR